MDKISNLKNIMIIGTGGTIAGVGETGKTASYDTGQINIENLTAGISHIHELANLSMRDVLSVDSCDITRKDWVNLANSINEMAKSDEIDGFVITHGTDTLEETAYFLNLTVKTNKPVVITGSMRPATATSPDGPFNLYQAVALAKSDEAVGKGVLVVFSDGIYGARDIQKVNTYKTDAFNQRDLGSLGFMRDDKVYFYNASLKKHTVDSEFDVSNIEGLPNVGVVYFYADADVRMLEYAMEVSDGLVIAGAGCGGSSIIWNDKIRKAVESGYPVVRSSRILNGLVTGEDLTVEDKGVCANTLSPQKARILLSLALTKTKDIKEIKNIFEIY